MASNSDASAALIDRTNKLLDDFYQRQFQSTELTSHVPLRSTGYSNSQHTDNLTRYTNNDHTGVSDEGLVMDPEDRQSAKDDLDDFRERVSTLKFTYLESSARMEFLSHVLIGDNNGDILYVSPEANREIAKERNQLDAELKEKYKRCAELEEMVRREAELLEEPMRKRREVAEYAQRLVKECEAMEMEIAMLKNKRSPAERMTLSQAADKADAQLSEITNLGQRTIEAERELKELRPRIKNTKLANERMSNVVAQLEREKKEREEKGEQDEQAEQGCEWTENALNLYKSLLGINEAYSFGGSPPTEIRVEYGISSDEGRYKRILSIQLGKDGRMKGAKLIDSSQSIQDLVNLYLPSQDLRSFVQEVRARIE